MKSFVLTALMTFASFFAGPVVAQAEEITTSETTVDYARTTLSKALGAEYSLVPGSIHISLRQPTLVDIGGAVRAVFGAEKVEYQVNFKVTDQARSIFSGRTFMTVEATDSTTTHREQDNNTTLRGTDPGTHRLIKIQLFEYHDLPQPISARSFDLKRLKKN